MIDLRSDTLTRPTVGMREAMINAVVGDDVYAEDQTVNEFEQKVADLFGHEAGLFCATGSLSNILGTWLHVPVGQELLCDVNAHIVRAEMGAHPALSGIGTRTWGSVDGLPKIDQINDLIIPDLGPFLVKTACIVLENTHNFAGGIIVPLADIETICASAHEQGLRTHLDGARIWNAHIATGTPLKSYGSAFDSVSVCFSKGLGAPVGSVLCSSSENIEKARIQRKRLGAGWRQAGILAAAADYALDHQLDRLKDDHDNAFAIAAKLNDALPGCVQLTTVQTNIVMVETGAVPAADVVAAAQQQGVAVSQLRTNAIRIVTSLEVSTTDCQTAAEVLLNCLRP